MPNRDHLHRLRDVWIRNPVYFLTVCVAERRWILAKPPIAAILMESWQAAPKLHGWVVGRYVIMPDHVHFFAVAQPDGKSLSAFLARLEEVDRAENRGIRADYTTHLAVGVF